jgi:hypothetical protein
MALKKVGAAAATPATAKVAAVVAKTAPKTVAKVEEPAVEDTTEVRESKVVVTRTAIAGGVEADPSNEEHVIAVNKFITTPQMTTVTVGSTRNVGDSNFIKCSVAVSIPSYREESDQAFEVAGEKAMAYLGAIMTEASVETIFQNAGATADDGVGDALAEGAGEDAGAEGAVEETAEADDGEITPEKIRAMSEEELTALCAANQIEISMDGIETVDQLAEAVIAAAFEAEDGGEAQGADDAAAADFVPYTDADLTAMSIAQLKEVVVSWGLDSASIFKGPPPAQKNAAKKAILAAQEG